jgi:hypothetical protein
LDNLELNPGSLGIFHKGKYYPPMAGGNGQTSSPVLEQLIAALQQANGGGGGSVQGLGGAPGVRYRATPSTPSTPYYTGPGGLFGVAGLEREIISTRITPMGLADQLPAIGTNEVQPMFGYFTGFTAESGSEPVGVCDDPPVAAPGKVCMQIAQFGRFSRMTRTLEVNRLGAQINRGEFTDLNFLNSPLGGMGGITVPDGIPGAVNVRNEVAMRMIEVGISFQNWITRKVYDGNPANNTGGDGYREFPGLDILINTGHVDALTNTACPSLDSDIKDFGYSLIGDSSTNNTKLITMLSAMMRYLRWNAQQMNFGDVDFAFVMRPGLFWELTAIWPCLYMTWRCQTAGGSEAFVDAGDMVRMRDDMRNGNYILIDGMRYPVILDSNIQEETNTTGPASVSSGTFASDIYIIPLRARGMPLTYWQYFDFRTSLNILGTGPAASTYFWTDGGRYMWHLRPPTNWCIQWLAKIEPRLILRTPHLAGRLTNVRYYLLQHERDVRNSDPYFVNGGVSTARAEDTRYANWSNVNMRGA